MIPNEPMEVESIEKPDHAIQKVKSLTKTEQMVIDKLNGLKKQ